MNKLGEKIKEIRLREGLSQDAFAKELGYNSRSTINKIEKGINEISYEKLMLFVKRYELEMDELFDRSKILKLERHKYNLKRNDKIINNKELVKLIDDFKWKLGSEIKHKTGR